MQLIVNAEPYELKEGDSLLGLLRELGANPECVAVLVNDEVVAAAARPTRKLGEGDRVEILAFAGGG